MTSGNRELTEQERAGKAFPVSWDQFHRDCACADLEAERRRTVRSHRRDDPRRAGAGGDRRPRVGISLVDTVCVSSYTPPSTATEGPRASQLKAGCGRGQGHAAGRRSRRYRRDGERRARDGARAHFATVYAKPMDGRWSIPSSPKCRRTPGFIFRGIPGWRSSRPSATARRKRVICDASGAIRLGLGFGLALAKPR